MLPRPRLTCAVCCWDCRQYLKTALPSATDEPDDMDDVHLEVMPPLETDYPAEASATHDRGESIHHEHHGGYHSQGKRAASVHRASAHPEVPLSMPYNPHAGSWDITPERLQHHPPQQQQPRQLYRGPSLTRPKGASLARQWVADDGATMPPPSSWSVPAHGSAEIPPARAQPAYYASQPETVPAGHYRRMVPPTKMEVEGAGAPYPPSAAAAAMGGSGAVEGYGGVLHGEQTGPRGYRYVFAVCLLFALAFVRE